jgi:phage protein D
MAITTGAGPHVAWLSVSGETFPIEHGHVQQNAKRRSSSFSAAIPLSYANAAEVLATLGDNEAVVTVLTGGVTAPLITGEVDETSFDWIGRVIRVTGRDKSAKLHDNKSSEKWLNKKPSEIVQDLIGRVGLSGEVAASAVLAGKKLEQDFVHLSDNVSFAYLIHKLAQLDGARWWVDPKGEFHYVPLGSPQGLYTITIDQTKQPIAADCLELKVHRNVQAGKTIATTVKSWHPKKKQVFGYTSNVEGNGGPVNYSYHIPSLLEDHAKKYARSQSTEKARHELTVSATVVGDPTVAAGMGLKLSGTGFFDQTYEIDDVQHDIGMTGHRTHITARAAKSGRQAS